jgi:hypothetical protein
MARKAFAVIQSTNRSGRRRDLDTHHMIGSVT